MRLTNKIFIILLLLTCFLYSESKYKVNKKSKSLVVLIHGLGDNPIHPWKLQKHIHKAGYSCLNFDYASTKTSMDSIITNLNNELLKYKQDYDSIYFVAHSLGSFVVRGYLDQYNSQKFQNTVFIAPPSKGSIIAERFENFKPFQWLFGEAGQKLGKSYDDYWRKLPAPNIPFAIIAGGIGTKYGMNPLIPGDDDGTVGVQETIIKGYTDFIIIPGIHTSLLWQQEVIDQVLSFLKNQSFSHE